VTTAGTVIDTGGAPFSIPSGNQTAPDISFHGTSALVVWSDARSGESDIYGSRFGTASVGLLDPNGIPISTAAGNQLEPAVSYYGPNYLVVWDDRRPGTGGGDIYATRVTAAGGVMDGSGVAFSTATNFQAHPDLAFDGTYELVVWEDTRSSATYDIYGAHWAPASGLLDPDGLAISTASREQTSPAVAVNGGFLVAWGDTRSVGTSKVYGTRVADNGTVADRDGIPVGSGGEFPALAAGGGKWASSYERNGDIFFTTIAPK
jgi:hypothetical protein